MHIKNLIKTPEKIEKFNLAIKIFNGKKVYLLETNKLLDKQDKFDIIMEERRKIKCQREHYPAQ